MTWPPTRRQLMTLGGAAATTGLLRSPAWAQPVVDRLRIGAIFPSRSGLGRISTSLTDFIGEGARNGSLMADQVIGDRAYRDGVELDVLQASAPTPEVAIRAAERLVELEDIDALVCGVGAGQLEVLLPIADAAGIPIFNVGTPDNSFRNTTCSRYLFHMEASDAMYLDAMIEWSAAQGHRRWFVVHEDRPRGLAMQSRAVKAIAKFGQDGEAVGAASTIVGQPLYLGEIEQARRAGADAILVLLNATDQIAFLGQLDQVQPDIDYVPFPDPVTQTRDYILSVREVATEYTPEFRFQLWDTKLEENGAAAFNERFLSRFSESADPTAWGAYQAVQIIYDAVRATGTTDADAMIAYLEDPTTQFDLLKGPGTSFRPWDHQLRQPIYLIQLDYDVVVDQFQLATRIDVANPVGVLPPGGPTDDPTAWLDRYGDGPTDSTCRF